MHNSNELSRDVARAAAHWLMLLHSDDNGARGEFSPEDSQACTTWRQAHLDHEQAWQRVQNIQTKLAQLPTDTGMKALNRSTRADYLNLDRRSLIALIMATPVGYLTYRAAPWQSWSADYSTNSGEQRKVILDDGSELHLNTNTLVDVRFSQQQRLVILRQGEVYIATGKDSHSASVSNASSTNPRPFLVQTSQGQLRPIGTRFTVREMADKQQILLSVLNGVVEATTKLNALTKQVPAGQQLVLSSKQLSDITPISQNADAWLNGIFYARNMRLADFINEISRYHVGLLRCDPAVAQLRISGAFQLKNTREIISALPNTLPVSLQFISSYWITIKPKA